MGLTVARIENVQEELFARIEDALAVANEKDYYLMGKDIYYYTMAMKNLEEMKRNAGAE